MDSNRLFGSTPYDQDEFQRLQRQLAERLPDQMVSERAGPSGKPVQYLETWKAIEQANQCFYFNGWSSNIVEITQDYCDEITPGRFSAGCSAIVRVSLRDGAFHEDLGYGMSENQRGKGPALELAKKKAISDGLKRALRNFGHQLGLSVYDKQKPQPPKRTMIQTRPAPAVVTPAAVPAVAAAPPAVAPAQAQWKAAPSVPPAGNGTVGTHPHPRGGLALAVAPAVVKPEPQAHAMHVQPAAPEPAPALLQAATPSVGTPLTLRCPAQQPGATTPGLAAATQPAWAEVHKRPADGAVPPEKRMRLEHGIATVA